MDANNPTIRINVISEMSSGKSTLINALLGKRLMPSKKETCTAIITEILDNGRDDFKAIAYNHNNEILREIPNLTYEAMGELNVDEDVYRIEASGNIPLLDDKSFPLMLVDTPSQNNLHSQIDAEYVYRTLGSCSKNIILYVLNGPQLSANNDSLLYYIAKLMEKESEQGRDRFLFIINKMDWLDPEEENIEKFIIEVKRYLANYGIEDPRIFPCSAYTALNIRTHLKKIDINNLTRAEERKLPSAARETLLMIDKFIDYEAMHLEKYSTLSLNGQRELNDKLSLAEENEDTKELALIHCGIYSIEVAISEYVRKYAKFQSFCEQDEEMSKEENKAKDNALPEVNIQDFPIEIGSASILGDTRDKLTIKLIDDDGKVYCFKSDGNEIVSYKIGGRLEKRY